MIVRPLTGPLFGVHEAVSTNAAVVPVTGSIVWQVTVSPLTGPPLAVHELAFVNAGVRNAGEPAVAVVSTVWQSTVFVLDDPFAVEHEFAFTYAGKVAGWQVMVSPLMGPPFGVQRAEFTNTAVALVEGSMVRQVMV